MRIGLMIETTEVNGSYLAQLSAVINCFSADVIILHVVEQTISSQALQEQVQQEMVVKLDEIADKISLSSDRKVESRVVFGKILTEVIKFIQAEKIELLLFRTNNSTEKHSRYLGTVTARMLRSVQIPMVLMPSVPVRKNTLSCDKILIPVDFSKDFSQGGLKFLLKYKLDGQRGHFSVMSVLMDVEDYQVNRLAQGMSRMKTLFEEYSISFNAEIVKSSAYAEKTHDVITDYARKSESGMLFINGRLESSGGNNYVSPLIQDILSHAEIPVICYFTG
jgi:nucleotide-binding universal stress UspA family protein